MSTEVDLHIHTAASDGTHSAREVVEMAKRIGLRIVAITDHDTLEAIPEAMVAAGPELEVIPGLEISCEEEDSEVHILGYFVRLDYEPLLNTLARSRQARLGRAKAMLERLHDLGIALSWERLRELAGEGAIGRPHIAVALCEAGAVSTTQEAFDRFLAKDRPAYVPRSKIEPADAIRLIHEAGGVAVLAHPWGVEWRVPMLCADGLDGLEVYYAGYSDQVQDYLLHLAEKHGLACAGGSDFHGLEIMPDRPLGATYVPERCVADLESRLPSGPRPRSRSLG